MDLLRQVEEAIRRERLLAPGNRVAVACSGGADSVALLRLLYELRDKLGLRLLVAHLNHQLRGADADADEEFVRRLAGRLELEFLVRREDVAARARREKQNLEEAGRQVRFEFFASLIAGGTADAVALAHTLDDQAETVLARIVRGAGTRGLAGIYPVVEWVSAPGPTGRSPWAEHRKTLFVRPLLGVRRAELRDYLDSLQQPWREDVSNLERQRLRNRLRLELLPQLSRVAGAAAIEHLARLADHARQEESFWAAYVEERFRALARKTEEGCELAVSDLLAPALLPVSLAARREREAQRAVARRLVRRVLAAVRARPAGAGLPLGGRGEMRGERVATHESAIPGKLLTAGGELRRITQTHVESVLRLAEDGQSGERVVLPGVEVERRFDTLVFRPAGAAAARRVAAGPYELEVEGPGELRLPDGQRLSFKLVAASELEPGYNQRRNSADAARAVFPLRVRNWRPGDRFQPVGATRRKKLKTLFQQERIPAGERGRLPLVLVGGEIAWVARLGVAAAFRLSPASRTALAIEEKRET
ncbi:MAG: tRNA lysidine(34) synthetase TilS [Acidobacteria bacterium]|nr:tRNA lysidine(34) synthetase TilS [Acidobacteriota bacterium]